MTISIKNNPIINYIKESREELIKVSWPSRHAVLRDTGIVIALSVTIALLLSALDFGLSTGVQTLLQKI